jgi:hypothetical protein
VPCSRNALVVGKFPLVPSPHDSGESDRWTPSLYGEPMTLAWTWFFRPPSIVIPLPLDTSFGAR